MAITTTRDEPTTMTAAVAVRVPEHATGDLLADAEGRLARVDGVSDVDVDGFQSIQPRLSATVVTVSATIETTHSRSTLQETLSQTVAVEGIERLERAG